MGRLFSVVGRNARFMVPANRQFQVFNTSWSLFTIFVYIKQQLQGRSVRRWSIVGTGHARDFS